jgi:hypothetical protein
LKRYQRGSLSFLGVIAGLDPAIHGSVRLHGCACHRRAKAMPFFDGYARA